MRPHDSVWLEAPSRRYLASYRTALAESGRVVDDDDARALSEVGRSTVPASTFWLVNGSDYVGTITIRHSAKGRVREIASHLYYEVRPSMRGKGYGTLLLKLGIEKSAGLGMRELILAVSDENAPSRRVAERNGAQLFKRVHTPDRAGQTLLYRIAVPTADAPRLAA